MKGMGQVGGGLSFWWVILADISVREQKRVVYYKVDFEMIISNDNQLHTHVIFNFFHHV